MIANQKSPGGKNKNQDQVIQQIKSIALQIFNKPIINLKVMDFEATGIFLQNYPKSHQNLHPYTERKFVPDDQQCKSQWITYQNFQQFDKSFEGIMEDENKQKKQTQKLLQQKRKNNNLTKPQNTKIKKPLNKKEKDIKPEKKVKDKSQKEQIKEKIKLQKLDEYGFMQQKGKLKQQAIQYIYHQKQKQKEEQNRIISKNTKTLDVLYTEKQPLYEKFLKQKQKKINSIYQSRVEDQKRQIQMIKEKPQINKNIKVEGNFHQRLVFGAKKAQQKKIKIINDMLKDTTFQPRINNSKRFNKVQSQVKKNWSQKSIDLHGLQLFQSKISYGQIGKGSKVASSRQSQKIGNRSVIIGSTFNVSNLKLSHATQLSNIFQIQDNTYQ